MNAHDIFLDTVVTGVVVPLMYFLKIWIKPSETEAKLLARILLGVGLLLIKFARRWMDGHKHQLDDIHSQIKSLKDKIRKSKVKVG